MLSEHNEKEMLDEENYGSKTEALIKLGLITVGTQITTELIHRLARYPVVVFGLGAITGFYAHKHRNKIIHSARQIQHQGKALLPFKSGDK